MNPNIDLIYFWSSLVMVAAPLAAILVTVAIMEKVF